MHVRQALTIPSANPPPLDVRRHALFLDIDGTLVEIAAHPDDVVAPEELRRLLERLEIVMGGALALITGRTIESADRVLSGALLNIAGVHGFERRLRGDFKRASDDLAAIAAAASDARALVDSRAIDARVENKTAGLAFHFRHAPSEADVVRSAAQHLAEKHGLSVLEGKMVVELTLGVRNKGDAIEAFMSEPEFAGRTPLAIGDDRTDEDAFAAARDLGGAGVLVGAARPSAAVWRLQDAAAVSAWLEAGLAA